jgi:hypothetical protein
MIQAHKRRPEIALAACLAVVLHAGSASAQSARAIDQEWCRQARTEIKLYTKALEDIRVEREQGIANLPLPAQQQQARRNLYTWYWQRMKLIERNTRLVQAECDDQTRLDPDATKISPAPTLNPRRPAAQQPRKNTPNRGNKQPLMYPPYRSPYGGGTYDPRRPASPKDPFSN